MYKRRKILGREGSIQVEQHATGFIGSTAAIILSTEPSVYGNAQGFSGGHGWDCLGVGWVMGREGVSDEMGEVTNG